MSPNDTSTWRRVPIQFAVAAAVAAGTAGAVAGAAIGNADDNRASAVPAADTAEGADRPEAVPVWVTVREQLRLRQVVADMPAGWPATEAMRRAAEQPVGDAVAREQWRRAAERMPAGWPATDAMRRAAADEG